MSPIPENCVLLLRHAETALNSAGRLRGRLDPPLDAAGEREAAELARTIAAFGPRRIVSSPLQRATATVAPLAELTGVPVANDRRLIDRDYGQWAGQAQPDAEAQWGSLDRAPGVEPRDDVTRRMLEVLNEQWDEARAGPVVLISHDATNSALLAALNPALGEPQTITQHTACWNMLHHRPDSGWVIDLVNQVAGAAPAPSS
ncbi:histidine phosphatase family protein [Actinomycetospora endophytica]|uniref:Histidine phosphatase family protein n=1 Tax=Actinomycetospora endophytica TaxID=2291215 RepID=A0ABS8PGE8_9PSEU|nr:histidine phosphatase family protein [Actinomycetospora endophytica]MCD2197342.1 histidine phosphatase family protein [Actinomycetospora endophytica]